MYCGQCGQKIKDEDKFCPYCGTEMPKGSESQEDDPVTWDMLIEEKPPGEQAATQSNIPEEKQAKEQSTEQPEQQQPGTPPTENSHINTGNIFERFWYNETFTKLAIRFDQFLELVASGIGFVCGILLFGETGFFNKLLAIILFLCGLIGILDGINTLFHKIKKDYYITEGSQKNPNKQKRNFLIGVPLTIFILFIIIQLCGSNIYDKVEHIAFTDINEKTIGEIVGHNIKNKEWSKEKIDKGCYRVAVTGYSPLYDDNIRISFYYEEKDDTYQVKLNRIIVGDETYDDALSASFVWMALCNYEEQLNQN